jgi:hypothetical protein
MLVGWDEDGVCILLDGFCSSGFECGIYKRLLVNGPQYDGQSLDRLCFSFIKGGAKR